MYGLSWEDCNEQYKTTGIYNTEERMIHLYKTDHLQMKHALLHFTH